MGVEHAGTMIIRSRMPRALHAGLRQQKPLPEVKRPRSKVGQPKRLAAMHRDKPLPYVELRTSNSRAAAEIFNGGRGFGRQPVGRQLDEATARRSSQMVPAARRVGRPQTNDRARAVVQTPEARRTGRLPRGAAGTGRKQQVETVGFHHAGRRTGDAMLDAVETWERAL